MSTTSLSWRTFIDPVIFFGAPLVLLPLPIVIPTAASRCAYVILLLIVYWVSECIPMAVTCLLPLILFPVASVRSAADVAPNYYQDAMSLLLGSLMLSVAIQNCDLHRRLALFVLKIVGVTLPQMLAGLMVTTWFLSMWINNPACISTMLPIALVIADEYSHSTNHQEEKEVDDVPDDESTKLLMTDEEPDDDAPKIKPENVRKCFVMAVGYSAVFGGFCTVLGSTSTIFLKAYVDLHYKHTSFHMTFIHYLLVTFPVGVIMLFVCWLWLLIRFRLVQWSFWKRKGATPDQTHLEQTIRQQYNELGGLRWSEWLVGILFITAVILWLTRDLGKFGGWSVLFPPQYISNGTVALFIGVCSMILPNARPFTADWKYAPIVSWGYFSKTFSWSLMFLLGAGLAIGDAAQASKLIDYFERMLQGLHNTPFSLLLLGVIFFSEVSTQFIGNITVAGILYPIVTTLARSIDVHPAYFLIPTTLGLAQSYLFPFSSQANAIVFSTGVLHTYDLITTSIILNLIAAGVIFLAASTWMKLIFEFHPLPSSNLTSIITNYTYTNST